MTYSGKESEKEFEYESLCCIPETLQITYISIKIFNGKIVNSFGTKQRYSISATLKTIQNVNWVVNSCITIFAIVFFF